MAQQKSEDRDKPQGRRKPVVTGEIETRAGGEAIPVDEVPKQLLLFPGSAEALPSGSGRGGAGRSLERLGKHVANMPGARGQRATAARMDEVISRLEGAFSKVKRNRGAPGPDGKTLELMQTHRGEWLPLLAVALAGGSYLPGDIRRVWIPKAGGGQRGLGIPNVIDRVVQEAVRQVLEPLYEPTFHRSSHGFRPERSCQTAIAEAVRYVSEGYGWVVDLDLERFFDLVNHQRLMSALAERVSDKALLVLIGRMLKAKVVLPDGLVEASEEGVPQGGPLSPLLSNIVLDELDKELERRGLRFVRYADDCNIYVRSERAGRRVMASVKRFIERRLRLKVNEAKSAVARPEDRHFLGFRLRQRSQGGPVDVLLSKRSRKRFGETLRQLVPRNFGNSLAACIRRLNEYLIGWIGFFGTCTAAEQRTFRYMDAHIRRRLRAVQLCHWKRKRTIASRLVKLGSRRQRAWDSVYGGRKGRWALSHTSAVETALRNSFWEAKGLVSIEHRWLALVGHIPAPVQLTLALG
jgi:group II intron reverse transcriptase/maturase